MLHSILLTVAVGGMLELMRRWQAKQTAVQPAVVPVRSENGRS